MGRMTYSFVSRTRCCFLGFWNFTVTRRGGISWTGNRWRFFCQWILVGGFLSFGGKICYEFWGGWRKFIQEEGCSFFHKGKRDTDDFWIFECLGSDDTGFGFGAFYFLWRNGVEYRAENRYTYEVTRIIVWKKFTMNFDILE